MSGYDEVNKIWSGPSRPSIYNSDVSLGYLILNILQTTPDRVIQVNADNGMKTTCGEMFAKTVKICRFLNSIGLKQNDVVGIVAKDSENLIPLVYACLTLGLPVNPTTPTEIDLPFEILLFSKTNPKVIFCDAELIQVVQKSLETCKFITLNTKIDDHEFLDEIIKEADKEVNDYEIPMLTDISSTCAFILPSSGTTSAPKGIIKTHKQLILHSAPTYQHLDIGDIFYITTNLAWITSVVPIVQAGLFGIKIVISSKVLNGDLFMDIVEKNNVTSFIFFQFLLDLINQSKNLRPMKSVRNVIIGGTVVKEDFIKASKSIFPNAKILAAYASTEASFVTHSSIEKGWSSGKATINCQIKIIDENGMNLGPNQPGEIYYKQKCNFLGYFGEPEKTAQSFADGWVISGDVGYFDDEGNIFVIQRAQDLLKYKIRFTSFEIEMIIDEIEGVYSSAVVGVSDVIGDILYAFVVKNPLKTELTAEFIEKYVESRVCDEKKIRGGVHFIDKIPLTITRKVKKFELRKIAEKIHKNRILKD